MMSLFAAKNLAGAAGAALALASASASASPSAETPPGRDRLGLRWSAPPGCPQADDIRALVRSYTRGEAGGELRAEASIVPIAGAWRMILTLNDEAKTIEGASCGDLGEAAAIVISLALAPNQAEPTTGRTSA